MTRRVVGGKRQRRKGPEGEQRVLRPARGLEIARCHDHLQGRQRQAIRLQDRWRQRGLAPLRREAARVSKAGPDLEERRYGTDKVAVAKGHRVREKRLR